jgi:hypothetical protein
MAQVGDPGLADGQMRAVGQLVPRECELAAAENLTEDTPSSREGTPATLNLNRAFVGAAWDAGTALPIASLVFVRLRSTVAENGVSEMAKLEKLLEQAKAHLDPGEQVLAAIQGSYETKLMGSDTVRSGILVATQSRLVFYAKKMGGYDLESFDYGKISSFEQSKSMMGHSVSFFASGNKVHMKWISDQAAMQVFVNTVKSNLHGGPQATIPGTNVAQQGVAAQPAPPLAPSASPDEDIMGKIRQLGELHEAGILSAEEFSTKKAELLARL